MYILIYSIKKMCQFFHNLKKKKKNRVILWCLLLYAEGQRASGVFCSLSYMDASFFILVYSFVVSFWPFFLTFLSRLCSFGS